MFVVLRALGLLVLSLFVCWALPFFGINSYLSKKKKKTRASGYSVSGAYIYMDEP